MSIVQGDIVRLKPEFQNRLQRHVPDVCGEVLSIGKLTARVAWDDGREHSSLVSNLELAEPPASTWNSEHVDQIVEERARLLVDAAIEVKTAWKKPVPSAATQSR